MNDCRDQVMYLGDFNVASLYKQTRHWTVCGHDMESLNETRGNIMYVQCYNTLFSLGTIRLNRLRHSKGADSACPGAADIRSMSWTESNVAIAMPDVLWRCQSRVLYVLTTTF